MTFCGAHDKLACLHRHTLDISMLERGRLRFGCQTSRYWLLEATQCFNQLCVHGKATSSSENSVIENQCLLVLGFLHHVMSSCSHLSFLCLILLLQFLYLPLGLTYILMVLELYSQTEFANPSQVLSDQFLLAFQFLGSWDSISCPFLTTLAFLCVINHILLQSWFSCWTYKAKVTERWCTSATSPFPPKNIKDVHRIGQSCHLLQLLIACYLFPLHWIRELENTVSISLHLDA